MLSPTARSSIRLPVSIYLLLMNINEAMRQSLRVVGLVLLEALLAFFWSYVITLLSHESLA